MGFTKIIVAQGQTCIDICRQYCGCDEALVDFVNDNNLPSYDYIPKPGTVYKVRNPVPAYNSNNLNIVAYYQANNIEISSGAEHRPVVLPHIITNNGLNIITDDGQAILITPAIHPILTNQGLPILTDNNLSINITP